MIREVLSCQRTTVDKKLRTSRHSVDSGLDHIERLVGWDGIRSPSEHHDTELHGSGVERPAHITG